MDKEKIRTDLSAIFNKVFKCGEIEITDTLTAADVERWDSLSHLTMISEVEKHFGIRFKLKELTGMKNTGELIQLVADKTA